jgi:hypothetical protein
MLVGYKQALLAAVTQAVANEPPEDERLTAVTWLKDNPPLSEDGTPAYDEQTPLRVEDVADAVGIAARMLSDDRVAGKRVTEALMRKRLIMALAHTTGAAVVGEKHVEVPGFQGVGPVDVVVNASTNGSPIGMVECKRSQDPKRDKIYEALWDAIKLALAIEAALNAAAYIVTGASGAAWKSTESSDLFETGRLSTTELWNRPLIPPGPHGGHTFGEDLLAGGYGNNFEWAHAQLRFTLAGEAAVDGMDFTIKVVQVEGMGELLRFADPPEFPERIDQKWLEAHIPAMDDSQFERLLERLRAKRWTSKEIEHRVLPLRNDST